MSLDTKGVKLVAYKQTEQAYWLKRENILKILAKYMNRNRNFNKSNNRKFDLKGIAIKRDYKFSLHLIFLTTHTQFHIIQILHV